MQGNEKNVLEINLAKSKAMNWLLGQPEFNDIFMKDFLKSSLVELIYREGSSDGVIKALDARKVFNDYVYDIIDQGVTAEQILKGN